MSQTWLTRFLLGLPCRAEDKVEMLRDVPELLGGPLTPHGGQRYSSLRHWHWQDFMRHPDLLSHDLLEWSAGQDWIAEADSTGAALPCPAPDCPLRNGTGGTTVNPEDPPPLELMTVGGGKGIGSTGGLDQFLNLVRKTHKDQSGPVKWVYLTDRYIFATEDENGRPARTTEALLEYLRALKLERSDPFTLVFWNSKMPQKSPEFMENFEAMLRVNYANASVVWYPKKRPALHDRFYLASGSSASDLRGVFGPSLNGLDGSDMYLTGALEGEVLAAIRRIIDGAR